MSDYQGMQEAKPKRSNVLFGCVIVALVMIVVGAGGLWWWFSSALTTDHKEIATLTAEIVPGAKFPDGYHGQVGVNMFGYRMVLLSSGTGEGEDDASIIMVQATPSDGEQATEQSMREMITEQTGEGGHEIEDLGTEAITVGGVETQFKKSRISAQESGISYLQYFGILPARDGGMTMFMIMGPADKFDRKGMDAFLGSIAPLGGAPGTAPKKR